MCSKESRDQFGLVSREIIRNDVDFCGARLMGGNIGQEGHELGRGMTRRCFAQDFTGLDVKGSVQRQRAVPVLLEAMPLGTARRERQHRIFAVQRLNRGLLVNAEHHGILWRLEIQPNHIGGLDFKVRIVGSQIAFEPMRLDPVFGPDTGHGHVRDIPAQSCRELARRPVCRSARRFVFGRPSQYLRFQAVGDFVAFATTVPGKQPRQPIRRKALAPAADIAIATIELGADFGPCPTLGEQKNQACMSRGIRSPIPRHTLPLQFHSFAVRNDHGALQGHHVTTFLNVTLH